MRRDDHDVSVKPRGLHFAAKYAALGWRVLPIEPGGKKPLFGCGIHHAETNLATISAWFAKEPDANIGIRLDTAGLIAVDIDPRNDGRLQLAAELPPTLTAKTGGGGLHLVYRAREGLNPPGKLCQGVDLKYQGYIVVAPSIHASGHAYCWQGWDVLTDVLPNIAPAPDALFACRQEAAPPQVTGQGLIAVGGRNDHLSHYAYKLRKKGLSIEDIEAVLLVKNRQECSPPLEEQEVRAIARGKEHVSGSGVRLEDFQAHMPSHTYLFTPTREFWPSASVNGRCPWPEVKGNRMAPASWLDKHRAVEQCVWYPGEPELIEHRVMQVSGWVPHEGARVFNLYRAPTAQAGEPAEAGRWVEHLRYVYPEDFEHIIRWLAHRVQRPGEKCNHSLVLGGEQGIGKDTALEPVKTAVGPWNWSEINPGQMLARFNGWSKAVIVRVNEARDLGDVDRFAFYDHSKTYMAAPPDVLRVDEKHMRETYVANVCGVIITTNHATDGLYLPADDRRHYVAWSPRSRGDFPNGYWTDLYGWMNAGGTEHVVAYLRALNLSDFDAKAPPPKTPAFWNIVAAGEAPESGELRDVIERIGSPDAVTLGEVIESAMSMQMLSFADELRDRKALRTIPHKMERVGYIAARNPDAEDGKFRIGGKRTTVYARRTLTTADQIRAARKLT